MIPQSIIEHEGLVRFAAFLGVFGLVAVWEAFRDTPGHYPINRREQAR